jgi:hypothetical protein
MRKDTLQYISDTIAIEALAKNAEITKQAGLFETLGFDSVSDSITNLVKQEGPADDSQSGWASTIQRILINGTLFRAHPLLGAINIAAEWAGIDLIAIGKKILSGIFGSLTSNASINFADVDRYAKIAIRKQAFFGSRRGGGLFGGNQTDEVKTILRNLSQISGRGRFKTLLIAVLVWTLKTALVGAGVVGAAGLIKSFIKSRPKKKQEHKEEPETEHRESPEHRHKPVKKEPISLIHSGAGNRRFKNDWVNYRWEIPLFGSLADTIVEWAVDMYGELSGYEDIIYDSPAFKRVIDILSEPQYDKRGNEIKAGLGKHFIPKGFASRKQIVDAFVRDVSKQIKNMELK